MRGRRPVLAFPRTKDGFDHLFGQNQVIVGNRHQMRPAFELLRSAQTWLISEQGLLLEAIAMLVTQAQDVPQANGHQIDLRITYPDEPTHARITLGIAGVRPFNPIARLFEMQVFPPAQADRSIFLIQTLPLPVRAAMGGLGVWAQFVAIFAGTTALARFLGSRSIEAAVAFQADQRSFVGQCATLAPEPGVES